MGSEQRMKPVVVDNSPQISARQSQSPTRPRVTFNQRLQYWAVLVVLKTLGWLPHKLARGVCALLAAVSYWLWPRLRRVGLFNLRLAFPEWTERQRRRVIYGLFQNFGRMLADYAHFPRWNRDNIESLIIYDGFENYARAQSQGRGVLFLTAHFGNWELGSFAHGLYGYPCHFVVREMDNPLIDRLINRYRCLSGGKSIDKSEFARGVLRAFAQGHAVGVLIDQNMLLNEGVFVDFFGRPACTTTGPARVARKTGVPIVLGLVIWDAKLKKYRLRFDRGGMDQARRPRGRNSGQHGELYPPDRRICAPLSGPMALGTPALENPAARGAAALSLLKPEEAEIGNSKIEILEMRRVSNFDFRYRSSERPTMKVSEIAELLRGTPAGDAEREILGVAALETAGPTELAYVESPRVLEQAAASRAGCLLVPEGASLPGHTTIPCAIPSWR